MPDIEVLFAQIVDQIEVAWYLKPAHLNPTSFAQVRDALPFGRASRVEVERGNRVWRTLDGPNTLMLVYELIGGLGIIEFEFASEDKTIRLYLREHRHNEIAILDIKWDLTNNTLVVEHNLLRTCSRGQEWILLGPAVDALQAAVLLSKMLLNDLQSGKDMVGKDDLQRALCCPLLHRMIKSAEAEPALPTSA